MLIYLSPLTGVIEIPSCSSDSLEFRETAMASQAVILSSSFTPKLATFNTPTPLLPLPPPRTFSCSSSLPTPCLKASYGGTRALHTSHFNQFKCYASPAAEVAVHSGANTIVGGWEPIPDVEYNKRVQALGEFAVTKYNEGGHNIKFIRVVEAEMQLVAGVNYRLWIQGGDGNVEKVYKAIVFVPLPVYPPEELISFCPIEWG